MDWKAYRAALDELLKMMVDPLHPQAFEAPLQVLEQLTPALREFSVVRELLDDARLQNLVSDCAKTMGDWEVRTQTLVLERGKSISTDTVERWNALWVRARDLAAGNDPRAGDEEICWAITHASSAVRDALRRMPERGPSAFNGAYDIRLVFGLNNKGLIVGAGFDYDAHSGSP